jgi:hypothetical protein
MTLMNALSIPFAVAATRRKVEGTGPDRPRTRKGARRR